MCVVIFNICCLLTKQKKMLKLCVVAWTLSLLWVKNLCVFSLLLVVALLLSLAVWCSWLAHFIRIIWVFNSPNNLSYIQSDYFFSLFFFIFFDSVSRWYLCEGIVLDGLVYMGIRKLLQRCEREQTMKLHAESTV